MLVIRIHRLIVNSAGTSQNVPPLFSHVCLPVTLLDAYIERGCNGDSQCPPNYASSHTWCTTQRTDAAISTGRFVKTGTITLPANYKNKDPGSAVGYTFMASSYIYDSDNESFTPTFMDSGSTSDYAVHVAGENYGVLYKVVKGSGPQTQGSYLGRVTSENENAYPDNGIHTDGYWYVKL